MEQLLPQALPAVPHITAGFFNLAISNIVAWLTVIVVFCIAVWARLPKIFVPQNR